MSRLVFIIPFLFGARGGEWSVSTPLVLSRVVWSNSLFVPIGSTGMIFP